MQIDDIKQFESVKRWFNMLALKHSGSNRTEEIYIRALRDFLDFHEIENPDILIEQFDAVKYSLAEREKVTDDFVDKIEAWAGHLLNKDLAKTTIARRTTSIKSFFKYNKVQLDWTPIRANAKYRDRLPTKDELRTLFRYSHMSNRMKAIISMLIESGLRIGTVLQLRYRSIQHDFEAGKIPCRVIVPRDLTKGKTHDYYSFIGENTISYLRQYLDKRKNGTKYLPTEEITPDSLLFRANSEEIKPVLKASVANALKTALLDLKIIEDNGKGKWKPIHPHTLRRYFRTYMNPAGFSWVHFWMGHVLKNNDEVYFRAPEIIEEARQAYVENYSNLDWTVKSEDERIGELQKTVASQRVQVNRLTQKLKESNQKVAELKAKLNDFTLSSDQVQQLLKRIEKLEKQAQQT